MNPTKKNLPECPCYAEGRSPFISLFNLKGEAVALNLAHVDRINYSAEDGITLTNGKQQLAIHGYNLEPLFSAIAAGEISQVRAIDPAARVGPSAITWVEHIGKATIPDRGAKTSN